MSKFKLTEVKKMNRYLAIYTLKKTIFKVFQIPDF